MLVPVPVASSMSPKWSLACHRRCISISATAAGTNLSSNVSPISSSLEK